MARECKSVGASFHGHIGRADARPSCGDGMQLHVHGGGEGSRRPTEYWHVFLRARRRRRVSLPYHILIPRAPWPSRRSALPRRWHATSRARRRRRVSPPYRQRHAFLRGKTARTEARPPTRVSTDTAAAKGLAALPTIPCPMSRVPAKRVPCPMSRVSPMRPGSEGSRRLTSRGVIPRS